MTRRIAVEDIDFMWTGFDCRKIKHLSNQQLSRLENKLTEFGLPVDWANVEEMNYLKVAWRGYQETSKEMENKICKLLNTFIRTKPKSARR